MYRHINPDILVGRSVKRHKVKVIWTVVLLKAVNMQTNMTALTDSTQVMNDTDREFGQNMDNKRAEGGFREKLKNILERIDVQSQRLSERVDIGELKRYRSLVKEFLDITVKNSSQFHKEHTLDSRGRHRIFAIVKKVDTELEDLTREVLRQQKDNINVLAKLDDIRGLLMDILT